MGWTNISFTQHSSAKTLKVEMLIEIASKVWLVVWPWCLWTNWWINWPINSSGWLKTEIRIIYSFLCLLAVTFSLVFMRYQNINTWWNDEKARPWNNSKLHCLDSTFTPKIEFQWTDSRPTALKLKIIEIIDSWSPLTIACGKNLNFHSFIKTSPGAISAGPLSHLTIGSLSSHTSGSSKSIAESTEIID